MVFDPNLPADTTKLRLLGDVITPNWVAIQNGESTFKPRAINLNNRTEAVPGQVNPVAITDAYLLYSRDNPAGAAELFGINESSGVTQFTVGAPSGTTEGVSFLPGPVPVGAFRMAWGNITMTTSPSSTVTPTGFTTVYQYFMTIKGNVTDNFASEDVGGNGFRFLRSGNTTSTVIRWMAIGV